MTKRRIDVIRSNEYTVIHHDDELWPIANPRTIPGSEPHWIAYDAGLIDKFTYEWEEE